MKLGDQSAFPYQNLGDTSTGEDGYTRHQFPGSPGMTYRQYLAANIAAGAAASETENAFTEAEFIELVLQRTDALIAALEKEGQ